MSKNSTDNSKKQFSPDWFVRGLLTKFGDLFDGFTGRKWQPSSSLATSELIEKLKNLLEADIRDLGVRGKFVPHNIKLKMQWDKFSTDSEKPLKVLEAELLSAAVDFINDRHYHTFAPLKLEVKADYFTEGVKLFAGFDKAETDAPENAVNVSVSGISSNADATLSPVVEDSEIESYSAQFSLNGNEKQVRLNFSEQQRLSVGRSRENNLAIEDASVSKVHASLYINSEKRLTVADTGSTNGTFINDERISYGKAYSLKSEDKVKFGTIDVLFKRIVKTSEVVENDGDMTDNTYKVDEFIFKNSRSHNFKAEEDISSDDFSDASEKHSATDPPK